VLGKSWPLIIAIQNSSDVEGIGGFKSELEANEWIAKDLVRKEGQSTNHHAEETPHKAKRIYVAGKEVAAARHRNFPRCRGVAPSHEQHVQEMPMAKKEKTLEDLFHETLKDIYYAEKKILTALPKMAKAAQSEDLQAAFEKHESETTDQVERLEQIFELIKHPAKGKTCDAINGILDESQEVMKEFRGSTALDAGLLASAQNGRAL
jgi:uncharacterized protein DUF892